MAELAKVVGFGVVVKREIDRQPAPLLPSKERDLSQLVAVPSVYRPIRGGPRSLPGKATARTRLNGEGVD